MPTAEVWKGIKGKFALLEAGADNFEVGSESPSSSEHEKYAYKKFLSETEWTEGLRSPDPVTRCVVASRPDFKLNDERLRVGLADDDENVRGLFISVGRTYLSDSDIDLLICDPSPKVRLALIDAKVAEFRPEQIERLLCDPEQSVRMGILSAPSFQPTAQQFFRTLDLGDTKESQAMLRKIRDDFVHQALGHSSASVRLTAYRRASAKLSPEEIERGLNDADRHVQLAVLGREDCRLPTNLFIEIFQENDLEKNQILRCKIDESFSIEAFDRVFDAGNVQAMLNAIEWQIPLTQHQISKAISYDITEISLAIFENHRSLLDEFQLGSILDSGYQVVRLRVLENLKANSVSESRIGKFLADPCDAVRNLVCRSFKLSDAQIAHILSVGTDAMKFALICRSDFEPSVAQFQLGISDQSEFIRRVLESQFRIANSIVSNINDENIYNLLKKISMVDSWTLNKKHLQKNLNSMIKDLGYTLFSTDARHAWFQKFGDHGLITVPLNHRGALASMRGKVIHAIRLERGTYSSVHFAAKVIGS